MTIDESQKDNPVKAVEDVLAFAVMKAGYMRKENFGHPNKVGWTRSSRTDKGVHSIATVVGLKMHCHDDTWESDPEGLQYAAAINKCVTAEVAHSREARAWSCLPPITLYQYARSSCATIRMHRLVLVLKARQLSGEPYLDLLSTAT
jgi:tRNA U38,U39,U40 pseudouridine synthase TruA